MNDMKQIEYIGKNRTFKRVKMAQLMDMQTDMESALDKAEDGKGQLMAMGKIVSIFLEPFDEEEMLEAEPDDFYLAQGLHLLATYYKHNKTKKEIDDLKGQIIDNAINAQLARMAELGNAQVDFQ